MNLAEAPLGASVTIHHVGGERSFRRRLMELGLVPGTLAKVLSRAPFGGPLELRARGCHLSIRAEEAAHLRVHVEASLQAVASTSVLGPAALSAAVLSAGAGDS